MTYQPKAEFLRVMIARGFMQDCTDLEGLDRALMAGEVPAYVGYDCTAPSLHVGSLVSIMMLHWLQETGHQPIVLMGGGTSKIGDPSGKDEARQLLSDEQIAANMAGIRAVFARFVGFGEAGGNAVMADNADWLDGLAFIPFLREFGRHFSINRMLTFDSVRARLDREQTLSFLEFSYMLLQAYDFLELWRRTGCRLQMGGSDQWGNIVNGVDLVRRVEGAEVFGLTTPLITTAGGAKMGKTAQGAVWLNEAMLPAYDYWQYWRNTADADVGRFLRLFTTLPLDEVARLEALEGRELNEAKKVLATEATTLAHGQREAIKAEQTALDTFERGVASAYLPTVDIPRDAFDDEGRISVIQLFVWSGLVSSGKDAKRLIAEGGARLDDDVLRSPGLLLSLEDFSDGPVKLSAGRKRHALARVV